MRFELRPWREMVGIVAVLIGSIYVLAAINTWGRDGTAASFGAGALGLWLLSWGVWLSSMRSPAVEMNRKLRAIRPVIGKSVNELLGIPGRPSSVTEFEDGFVVITWRFGEKRLSLNFLGGTCFASHEENL